MSRVDGMDRNAMLQGNQNPVPGIGVISGKASLDFVFIQTCQKNADDIRVQSECFPGGSQPINHDAMPGDSSFGLRDVRNAEIMDGEPNELGIVSVAGLHWGSYCSQRQMEDDFYWQGIVTTESRLTNPLDSATGDPDHGYGTARCGTMSVINNGWKTFTAGTKICWQFPAAPFHPGGDVYKFEEGNKTNYLARYGVPTTQFRPEYVPFDHLDFKVHFAGAFAAMTTPKSRGGVSDLGFMASLPNQNNRTQSSPFECLQEEANGYKNGFSGIGFALVELLFRHGLIQKGPRWASVEDVVNNNNPYEPHVASDAEAIEAHKNTAALTKTSGLWDFNEDGQKLLIEFMADLFLKSISPLDPHRDAAVQRFETAAGQSYFTVATSEPSTYLEFFDKLRIVAAELTCQGVTGSWHSKLNKVVGVALNDAAPADTLHGLFGHHRY